MARKYKPTTINVSYDDTLRAEYQRTGRTERVPTPPPSPEPGPAPQIPRKPNRKAPRIVNKQPASLAFERLPQRDGYQPRNGRARERPVSPMTASTRRAAQARADRIADDVAADFARKDEQ